MDDIKTIDDLKVMLNMCSISYINDLGSTTLAKRSIEINCGKMTNDDIKWLKEILDKNNFQYKEYFTDYLYVNKIREYL